MKCFTCACLATLVGLSAQAQSPVTYKMGGRAPEDIVATVPFDVVDAQATAALRASEAATVPAIFREDDAVTNVMAGQFLAAFARAHTAFSNAIMATYQQPAINEAAIEAPNFGYFVTAYNVVNRDFPVTAELAAAWARGDSGAVFRDQWLGWLLQTMSKPVRPDGLPAGFTVHQTIRIVPAAAADETLSPDSAGQRGRVMPASDALTLAYCRAMFRREFSADDQPLAGALSKFLQADCLPDAALTQEARDLAAREIVVARHFEAGQVIVRRGETIDAGAKAALDQWNRELMPGGLNRQMGTEQQQTRQEGRQADAMREHDERFLGAFAGVSLLALAILWRLVRRPMASVPARLQKMEKPAALPPELAPMLARTLQEAVVQGLAAQRAEMLEAQRQAAMEIAALAQRLEQLQAPLQERLRAYEERIQELQKELAERTEENRELLKLKIEMMRRQIEAEPERVKFN